MIVDELGRLRLTARKVNRILENPGIAGAQYGAMNLNSTRVAKVNAAIINSGSLDPARVTSGGAFAQTPGYADATAEADMTALVAALNAAGVIN